MIQVLFAAKPHRWDEYEVPLKSALAQANIEAEVSTDVEPSEVDYIVYAPNGPVVDFSPYTKAKAVLNLWAGVEDVVDNQTLTVPLCRMVDHGLTEGMVEWVVGHTLRHHLGIDTFLKAQNGEWLTDVTPPLARDRIVCVLGLGELGSACARALSTLNFQTRGWARSQKNVPGVACFSGPEGFEHALTGANIVILLLPMTADTENVLNHQSLAKLAPGAVVLNPGRGPLIDDNALLAALDSDQISHATLDVFRTEPLPADHAYWSHPKVTVTPHIASETRTVTASQVIVENIKRGEEGLPFLHQVDRKAGY